MHWVLFLMMVTQASPHGVPLHSRSFSTESECRTQGAALALRTNVQWSCFPEQGS